MESVPASPPAANAVGSGEPSVSGGAPVRRHRPSHLLYLHSDASFKPLSRGARSSDSYGSVDMVSLGARPARVPDGRGRRVAQVVSGGGGKRSLSWGNSGCVG